MSNSILATEWSEKFDTLRFKSSAQFTELRKKMMEMSYYKYGPLRDNYKKEKCINAIGSLEMRLEKFEETHNLEFLADVANFAMIEYMYPQHEHTSYSPVTPNTTQTHVDVIKDSIQQYKATGNTAFLVIVANFAELEFNYPQTDGAAYEPTDSGACDIDGFGIQEIRDFDKY